MLRYLTVKISDSITAEAAEIATVELATRKAAAKQASDNDQEDDVEDDSNDDSDIIED